MWFSINFDFSGIEIWRGIFTLTDNSCALTCRFSRGLIANELLSGPSIKWTKQNYNPLGATSDRHVHVRDTRRYIATLCEIASEYQRYNIYHRTFKINLFINFLCWDFGAGAQFISSSDFISRRVPPNRLRIDQLFIRLFINI